MKGLTCKDESYFPESYEHSGENVKVELSLSNCLMKADLKGATSIDTSALVLKTDLAGLKTKVDNLNVDKLKSYPSDLGKHSNEVNNDAVKKTVHDKLNTKVNAIVFKIPSTSGLVIKAEYDFDKVALERINEDVDKETTNTGRSVKKTDYNRKIREIENKTRSVTDLVTTFFLNTKATEIENKTPDTKGFITSPEFSKLTKIHFDSRMKETTKNLASKSQADAPLNRADKNREKIKGFKTLI